MILVSEARSLAASSLARASRSSRRFSVVFILLREYRNLYVGSITAACGTASQANGSQAYPSTRGDTSATTRCRPRLSARNPGVAQATNKNGLHRCKPLI